MMKTWLKNRIFLSVFLSLFIFLIVMFIGGHQSFLFLNKKAQNSFYSLRNQVFDEKVSDQLVIIEIDNNTLAVDKAEDLGLGRFPFDRKSYIPVINNLKSVGASVIAFDMLFEEKTSSDVLFANAIRDAGNVYVGSFIGRDKSTGSLRFYPTLFESYVKGTGFVSPAIQKINNTVYSLFPYKKLADGKVYEHFTFSVLRGHYENIYKKEYPFSTERTENEFLFSNIKPLPFSSPGSEDILINFSGYNDFRKENNIISFIDVYDQTRFQNLLKHYSFQDKIVLIGATASGIKDIVYTPNGQEYGVYTHANMMNTILRNSYLRYFDTDIERSIIFLLIILSVYFNLSRSSYVLVFSNIAIVIIFLLVFPRIIVSLSSLILNYYIELIFALILSLTLSNLAKYLSENKNRVRLSKALSEYVSEDVAQEILSGDGKVNIDGENKKIAMFFSDIQGFTSISEKFSPEELVGFLREYLKEMSNIIMDERGFINKYEGDAIMALWGAFTPEKRSSYYACLSAIKQQRLLVQLNTRWKQRGFGDIKARIGIHYGDAIIGNIGSEGRKMEFTALGDNVNLASRMEGVNKFYGTYICVSESIYEECHEDFEFRFLDIIRVKGKTQGVKIYQLLEEKGNISDQQKTIFASFSKARSLYQQQKFSSALEIFQNLAQAGDAPSATYVERSQFYIKNPPGENWDTIWTMTSK